MSKSDKTPASERALENAAQMGVATIATDGSKLFVAVPQIDVGNVGSRATRKFGEVAIGIDPEQRVALIEWADGARHSHAFVEKVLGRDVMTRVSGAAAQLEQGDIVELGTVDGELDAARAILAAHSRAVADREHSPLMATMRTLGNSDASFGIPDPPRVTGSSSKSAFPLSAESPF